MLTNYTLYIWTCRFLGTTPRSSTIRRVLKSIMWQIKHVYKLTTKVPRVSRHPFVNNTQIIVSNISCDNRQTLHIIGEFPQTNCSENAVQLIFKTEKHVVIDGEIQWLLPPFAMSLVNTRYLSYWWCTHRGDSSEILKRTRKGYQNSVLWAWSEPLRGTSSKTIHLTLVMLNPTFSGIWRSSHCTTYDVTNLHVTRHSW